MQKHCVVARVGRQLEWNGYRVERRETLTTAHVTRVAPRHHEQLHRLMLELFLHTELPDQISPLRGANAIDRGHRGVAPGAVVKQGRFPTVLPTPRRLPGIVADNQPRSLTALGTQVNQNPRSA